MNYPELATNATIFLTPFLPYLVAAGTESVKEIGKSLGSATWEKAKSIWTKITTSSSDAKTIQTFAEQVAKNPTEVFQASLAQVLAEHLQKYPALATEIFNLMKDDDNVQKILVEQQSTVKNIFQKLTGPGNQDVTIRNSNAGNITQIG